MVFHRIFFGIGGCFIFTFLLFQSFKPLDVYRVVVMILSSGFSSDKVGFHLMMIVFFFFTVILMLNVLIGKVNPLSFVSVQEW